VTPLKLIVAQDRNGAIGKAGGIPWRAAHDLAFFKRVTNGGALIMGRKTWESLPKRPLPGREAVVVTSNPEVWTHTAPTPQDALALARSMNVPAVFGAGGSGVYKALMPFADELIITDVDLDVDGADTFFPQPSPSDWVLHKEQILQGTPHCLVRILRRKS